MSEDRYCIKYKIIDSLIISPASYFYEKTRPNLTKEEADIEVKRLNDEKDLRIQKRKYSNVYFEYFSKKVN